MKFEYKLCGEHLRKRRREKEFSQEYVAFQLGITQSQYSKLENGDLKITIPIAIQIADLLQIPIDELTCFFQKRGE